MKICKDFQELAQRVFNEEYTNGTEPHVILKKLENLLEKHGYNANKVWPLVHKLYENYEASLGQDMSRL